MAKGHKVCSHCQSDNGARALVCGQCNEPFDVGQADAIYFYPTKGLNIYTPAGKCPVPWEGDLTAWVDGVRATKPDDHFTDQALRYWLRTLVPAGEYEKLATELLTTQLSSV